MKKISTKNLEPLLTISRIKRIDKVLSKRTKGISVLLEDIYQGHNISAVLRTCDNLGIQNIYIIQDSNKIKLSKGVSLGSEKWVTLNIKKRDRSYEQEINWKYLDALNQIYNEFFMKYDKSPLIIINTNDIDFVNNPKDLDEIINFIRIPTKGTRYFNPMKSL